MFIIATLVEEIAIHSIVDIYAYFYKNKMVVVSLPDPSLRMGARINSAESQQSGNPPGTRPEVQNGEGVAEDSQTHRAKYRAV